MANSLELLVKNIQFRLAVDDRKPAWLAKESGVPPATLSRILNHERMPTLDTIAGLAEGFKTNLIDLLTFPYAVDGSVSGITNFHRISKFPLNKINEFLTPDDTLQIAALHRNLSGPDSALPFDRESFLRFITVNLPALNDLEIRTIASDVENFLALKKIEDKSSSG